MSSPQNSDPRSTTSMTHPNLNHLDEELDRCSDSGPSLHNACDTSSESVNDRRSENMKGLLSSRKVIQNWVHMNKGNSISPKLCTWRFFRTLITHLAFDLELFFTQKPKFVIFSLLRSSKKRNMIVVTGRLYKNVLEMRIRDTTDDKLQNARTPASTMTEPMTTALQGEYTTTAPPQQLHGRLIAPLITQRSAQTFTGQYSIRKYIVHLANLICAFVISVSIL